MRPASRDNPIENTVKRYARMQEPTGDRRAPRYKPTLVDPYRDHPCAPAAPPTRPSHVLQTIARSPGTADHPRPKRENSMTATAGMNPYTGLKAGIRPDPLC